MAEVSLLRYSFQPGPAQLYPDIASLVREALQQGLLSRYHRDPLWRHLFAEAQQVVSTYLSLPKGTLVVFVSSATEAWQILVDATADLTSLHIIQGTFGKRWYELQSAVTSFAYRYAVDETQHWGDQLSSLSAKYKGVGFVAAVQTETSRGVALPDISKLREAFPEALIAVDATSSLGGLQFPWECADVWFASVQKCLGLPPGLALLLLLPPAVERFQGLPRNRYNSLSYLIARGMEHEPPFTPNLLAIYLVAKSLAQRPPLSETDKILKNRAAQLYRALEEKGYKSPVSPEYRAHTVLSFSWDNEEEGRRRRTALEKQGLYIGWGHGPEREHLFRIANFPALPDEAYMELLSHL